MCNRKKVKVVMICLYSSISPEGGGEGGREREEKRKMRREGKEERGRDVQIEEGEEGGNGWQQRKNFFFSLSSKY